MTSRRLVEALLVAALVPVGVVGVQSWRDAASEPAPRVVAPAIQRARPQLGRSTPRQPMDSPSWPAAEAESTRAEHHVQSDIPTMHGRPHGSVAVAERQHAGHMVRARLDNPRHSAETQPRRGGSAGLPGSSPLAATSSAGGGSAASSIAAVEFVGVMHDLTLLKRNDFVADLVRQLKIIVYWKVSGNHAQRLELFTPDGSLYRRVATDFTGTSATATGTPVTRRW